MGRPIRNDYISITAGWHGYRLANTRGANQAPNRSRFALHSPPAQGARRDADDALERAAEGGLGLVAEAHLDFGNGGPSVAQQAARARPTFGSRIAASQPLVSARRASTQARTTLVWVDARRIGGRPRVIRPSGSCSSLKSIGLPPPRW